MTKPTAYRRLSSFTDMGEAYAEMTPTDAIAEAFHDTGGMSIIDGSHEREQLDMPDPRAAQHDCAAIIATIFDLFRDTKLEASATAIAWGIVNSFHYEARKLERREDDLAREVGELARTPDVSEIYSTQIEDAQLKCQTVAQQRAAIEAMRDYAAIVYHAETGLSWSPARGSKVSSVSTASQIAARDFMKARALAHREKRNPTGPIVVFSGGAVWHDWQQLYDRLDQIRARIPTMTLCTTAQRQGADAIAAAWAAKHGVPLVAFTPDSRLGNRAGFERNKRLASLNPVEAIVCQGSGIQSNLLDTLKDEGVPTHAFRADRQAPIAPDRIRA